MLKMKKINRNQEHILKDNIILCNESFWFFQKLQINLTGDY